jgi:intracellular sulfur oxidation DsrE/DsrF family protein
MERRRLLAAIGTLSLLAAGCAGTGGDAAKASGGQDKVVYHINEGFDQASNGLRNIGNHLEVNPSAKIVVVSHAKGVDFLMKGAKDKNGSKYEDLVERLKLRRAVRCLPDHAAQSQAEQGSVHRVRDVRTLGSSGSDAASATRGLRVPQALMAFGLDRRPISR